MSPTPEIETYVQPGALVMVSQELLDDWLDDADRDLLVAAAALDAVKARRARIIAALVALGDEIEAEVPPARCEGEGWIVVDQFIPFPPALKVLNTPAPVDEDPVADEMPVAWPV